MIKNSRFCNFISLLIIIPLGLGPKIYTGFGQGWVNDYAGDILYEIAWCLFFFWFFPSKKATVLIPIWVFLVTCIIEICQLWFGLIPETIRSSIIWKLLLGSTFVWWDFPHYALGCLIGWFWLSQIWQKSFQ
ncbi:hypothetical protein STA3757_01470 [Stanieria sp. NIES-3757]|nr:hypothetical protein STA3757_01470 [Stanieria sp. NIES-3757]